jgi:Derlin-2/3
MLLTQALTELAWRYTPLMSGPYFSFLPGLIMAACYTGHQDRRGQKASFWFFTIPAQLLPYCMMLIGLISDGPYHIPLQITAIIVAHMWDFATRLWPEFGDGANLLPTPGFMSYLVKTPRVLQRTFGTAIRPPEPSTGSSTGHSSGPLPDSWRSRGSGHRLG